MINETVEVRVLSSTDDAEEAITTGAVSLTSSDLELGFDGAVEQIAGMRFNGILIPQGAIITNAYLEYQADEASNAVTNLSFSGEASDDASAFSSTSFNISSRNQTTASVSWNPGIWSNIGDKEQSPNLSTIIQEIIDRPGWQEGNSLVLTVTGSGERVAESFDGNAPDAAPLLHIEYSTLPTVSVVATTNAEEPGVDGLFTVSLNQVSGTDTEVSYTVTGSATPDSQASGDYVALSGTVVIAANTLSATIPVTVIDDFTVEETETITVTLNSITGGDPQIIVNTNPATVSITNDDVPPIINEVVEVRVSSSADDAEENLATGVVDLTSSDLELGFDGAREQVVGMRFTGLDIPQGAIITSAYLEYQADEAGSAGTMLSFFGEASDNAAGFSTTAFNISSRNSTTATVSWAPAQWSAVGDLEQTPDLSAIIQEIIDRPGWQEGNSLVLTVAGTGARVAESFNGNAPGGAPLLHVVYSTVPSLSIEATVDAGEPTTDGFFTVSLDHASSTDTEISYTVTGSATPDSQGQPDYVALSGTVVIAANTLSTTIPVTVIDDLEIEDTETVTVTLNGITSGNPTIYINTASATMNILNDDVPTEVMIETTTNAEEPGVDGLFTVSLNQVSGTDTEVSYTVTGSATPDSQASGDYVALSGTVVIAANTLSATIPVTVIDDPNVESFETVTLMLNNITAGDPEIIVNNDPATMVINDDDTFSFLVIGDSPYSTRAGDEEALSEFVSAPPSEAEFIIHLGDIKAGNGFGSDYSAFDEIPVLLQQSPIPVFIIPGDNEYNDMTNPTAAWAAWESSFLYFDQNWNHNFSVNYQVERPENFSFVTDNTLFVGINLVGGRIFSTSEWNERQADDLKWIEDNFADYGDDVASAVIFGHASPSYTGYGAFEEGFIDAAQDFADPILYLQGDLHGWDISQPYSEAPNITKVIIEQTGVEADPLLVTITNTEQENFSYDHDFA